MPKLTHQHGGIWGILQRRVSNRSNEDAPCEVRTHGLQIMRLTPYSANEAALHNFSGPLNLNAPSDLSNTGVECPPLVPSQCNPHFDHCLSYFFKWNSLRCGYPLFLTSKTMQVWNWAAMWKIFLLYGSQIDVENDVRQFIVFGNGKASL